MTCLSDLVARLEEGSPAAHETLNRWYEADPASATVSALRHLGRYHAGAGERQLARFLAFRNTWNQYLLNPKTLTTEEALAAAKTLSEADVAFSARLQSSAESSASEREISRAFAIIASLGLAHVMVPWLQRMSHHPDPFFQSKAALMLCRATGNPMVVERLLHAPDARVRANAVEALWNIRTPVTSVLLRQAVQDTHHRVAINALLGLDRRGERGMNERMISFAKHESAAFRAAIAWAMGRTADPKFNACLKTLAADPTAGVRRAADAALNRAAGPGA